MPLGYELPSYLHPQGDPVQFYAEGLRLGASQASAAAEQARAEERQALMLREEQRALVDQQMKAQEFALKQQQAARRYAAQDKYQSLIASGVDPARALLQVAPDLGESLHDAAALYKQTMPSDFPQRHLDEIIRHNKALETIPKFHDVGGNLVKTDSEGNIKVVLPKVGGSALDPIDRMDLQDAYMEARAARKAIDAAEGDEAAMKKARDRLDEAESTIRRFHGNAPPPGMSVMDAVNGGSIAPVGSMPSTGIFGGGSPAYDPSAIPMPPPSTPDTSSPFRIKGIRMKPQEDTGDALDELSAEE